MPQPIPKKIKQNNPEIDEKPFKTLLVDGSNVLELSHSGDKRLSSKGEQVGGIFQFLLQLRIILAKGNFRYVYVFWDGDRAGQFRFNELAEYKANRDKNFEEENSYKNILDKLAKYEIVQDEEKKIANVLNFEYLFKKATTIPTKTSVTEIKKMQEESANENTIEKSAVETQNEYVEVKNENIEIPKPKFLQTDEETKITNAEKGTLIHLCMQKLDITKKEYLVEDIKKLVDELQIKKIISQKEAEAININKVYQFTKTALWNEIVQAKEVQREKPFYISIPAKEIYKENSNESEGTLDEEIIVQGIIDLYYINNNNELILVDFKTDYVPNNEEQFLVDKYKSQLELYKKALESAKGFIRHKLFDRMDIRQIPELTFIYDESIEYGKKIEEKIKELNDN